MVQAGQQQRICKAAAATAQHACTRPALQEPQSHALRFTPGVTACRYVQQNCLRSLDGLEHLPNLNTLNVSSNSLSGLQELQACPELSTLVAERNHLSTAAGLQPLLQCTSLHTLDLQHNDIEDTAVVDVIVQMPQLRCLYLAGNPVVSKIPNYRKAMIARCAQLTYLDDRPVTEEERLWSQAW